MTRRDREKALSNVIPKMKIKCRVFGQCCRKYVFIVCLAVESYEVLNCKILVNFVLAGVECYRYEVWSREWN